MATARRASKREVSIYDREMVALTLLRPHPRNYRSHADDQIAHIKASLQANGFYRNIVIAQDHTILAGHGVVEAAQQLGLTHAPVIRLPLDPMSHAALKILTGDNEMARLAMCDDRALTELLKDIRRDGLDALLGTGFDDTMLSGLVYISRPVTEIGSKHDASQWAGLPEYDEMSDTLQIIISCEDKSAQLECLARLNITNIDQTRKTISTWWPPKTRNDLQSVRFEVPHD
jgi:hypothetical protein